MALDPKKKKLICCGSAVTRYANDFAEAALINEETLPGKPKIDEMIDQLEKMAKRIQKLTSEVSS